MVRILGLERGDGRCFREIADAVSVIDDHRRPIVFMAHAYPAPAGSILFHWENGPLDHLESLRNASAIWDFSRQNVDRYPLEYAHLVRHVPCGYHPSMERFHRRDERFDIAWVGCLNTRRRIVLDALRRRGLKIIAVPARSFGPERDQLLAVAKIVLNVRYYEDGVFPVLRSAHATANRIVTLAEDSPELPDWSIEHRPFEHVVDRAVELASAPAAVRKRIAEEAYERFRASPLRLPACSDVG